MTLPLDELSIIDRFFRPLAGEGSFELRDDAARLPIPAGRDLVVTADMIAAGVHFLPDDPPGTIAQKALRVNLSDLAAKGAQPLGYVLAAGLGAEADEQWLRSFAEGLRSDQRRFGIALLGGDTIRVANGPVLSVTAFGTVSVGRMVHRFGGRPGDALFVSGVVGAAAAGLALLRGEPGPWAALPPGHRATLIASFRVPEPRISLAHALGEYASAAMDVSDGLVGDCDKLAGASGCSARLDAEHVPLPAGLGGATDEALVARLITAGDDYEILAAVAPAKEAGFVDAARRAGVPLTRIGQLTAGAGRTDVLWNSQPLALPERSYVHGRARNTEAAPRNRPETGGD